MPDYEWDIALRYLKGREKGGFLSVMAWITVTGILLGVMALVVALSFASGFESALRDKIIGINAHLLLLRYDGALADWEKVKEQLLRMPEVEAVTPFTYHQGLLRSEENVSGIVVRGVIPETIPELSGAELSFTCGGLFSLVNDGNPGPPIWLGKSLAETLGVGCGQTVKLIALSGDPASDPGASLESFQVAGVFEVGMYEYDASLAFLPLEQAQRVFKTGDRVTGLEIQLIDMRQADAMEGRILGLLGYPYWVKTWKEINPNFFSALKLQKVVMFLVLVLIVLVGGFNIISTLIMSVIEKRQEIAILKAMGATRRSVGRIFFFQGLLLGLAGTLLGLTCGLVLCRLAAIYPLIRLDPDVYYLSHLPVEIRVSEFLLVGLSALLLCGIATFYPAIQAAALDPAEALRYE